MPDADAYIPPHRAWVRGIDTATYAVVALTGLVATAWAGHPLATAAGAGAAALALVCLLAHLRQWWMVEQVTVPLLGLSLVGYVLGSSLYHPWFPGGLLFALFVIVAGLSLARRLMSLLWFAHDQIRMAQGHA